MSAPTLDRPLTDDDRTEASAPAGRRGWVALLSAGALAASAGVGVLLGGGPAEPVLVTPVFEDGVAVVSAWGGASAEGIAGSWIVNYIDGTSTTIRVPWSGGAVDSVRLLAGPVDLLTVTDARVEGDELVLTTVFDGCDYYHERALQSFPTATVTTADGATTELTFDHPLFVRSPMLWQCPDRLIDRQAKIRSDL